MKNKVLFFFIVTMFAISSCSLFGASNSPSDTNGSNDSGLIFLLRSSFNAGVVEIIGEVLASIPLDVLSSYDDDVVIDEERIADGKRVLERILACIPETDFSEPVRKIKAEQIFSFTPYGCDHYLEPDLCIEEPRSPRNDDAAAADSSSSSESDSSSVDSRPPSDTDERRRETDKMSMGSLL